ncbi:MAG: PKD domain-containing protein [Bacteroidia bacterium]|nr:PKD domain-containing protein [Bacteroidia bacterium]
MSLRAISLRLPLILYCLLISKFLFAQQDIQTLDKDSINQLKISGQLTGKEFFTNSKATFSKVARPITSTTNILASAPPPSCDCWVPRDASWNIGEFDGSGASGGPGMAPEYRNDDWSTIELGLPFNFCFYGDPVDSVFLNNNGNVSIGAPYSTFTANAFPDPSFVMIAPFWGDVDTRDTASGLVYYKITPTYMIVQWENVGYFSQQSDKINTFQLIISDGLDPILPAGQNTSFCYRDMQWTTGSASGGVNGFGGTPATVGVNRGDGVDFIQIGRFDMAGSTYDGPFLNNDGIDALDNQVFYFNSCVSSSNVAPLVTAIQICDTLKVCINDTIQIYAEFLAPEQGQVTVAGVNPNGMSGVSILSATSGSIASITVQVVGLSSNIGFHTIYVTGTDNGAPPLTNSTPVIVQVMPAPTPNFSFSPPSPITPGATVTFTNGSVGAFTYSWDFGDGFPPSTLSNPTHSYANPGTYDVTLTATGPNGCSASIQHQVIVAACASASFTVIDTICAGTTTQVTFTGVASSGATFNWNFGTGTIVSGSGQGPYTIRWANAGNETISLSVTDNPCTPVNASLPVTVVGIPIASITTTPAVVCIAEQSTITFSGTSNSWASYNWNFGSATVLSGTGAGPYTLSWTNSGPANIGLIVSQSGCTDSIDVIVQVNQIPSSTFIMPTSACANETVQINYTGTASASANYVWNFSGATILSGNGQGPYQVNWSSGGTPSVTLSVIENACTSSTSSNVANITPGPLAAFSALPSICIGDQNSISFTGSPASGANYSWDFAAATIISGTGSGPYVLSWSTSGIKTIELIVSQNGCADTTQFNITVNPIPTSTFSIPVSICPGDTAEIIYTGSALPSATYNWNFNGGIIINGTGVGPYLVSWPSAANISLSVTQNGCVSPLTQNNIAIENLPAVNAGLDTTICSGDPLQIGVNHLASNTYSWYPATGITSPDSGITSVNGLNTGVVIEIRNYVLTATSPAGCKNRDTVSVIINPIPVVAFTSPSAQCFENNSFQFYAGGNRIPGTQYSWNFGAQAVPQQSSLENPLPVHFMQIGTHQITLEATFGNCVALPFSDNIIVAASPVAEFDALTREGCVPLTVPFINQSVGGNSYYWTFSDQGSDTLSNATHVFSQAGIYSVDLLTVSPEGCTDNISHPDFITVHPLPEPSFTPSPERTNILEPLIQFMNSTPGINQYYWEFGDGDSSYSFSPNHMYKELGTYTVTLYVENIYGCRDTISALVRIEDDFTFYIPNTFSPNGDGRNDFFSGFGTRFQAYHLDILDRWGLVVYSTNDYSQPWDGRVKNEVQADTYIYKIQVTDNEDKTHEYTGHVNVIR